MKMVPQLGPNPSRCAHLNVRGNNGKQLTAVRIIQHTLEFIHLLTDQNPIQAVVDAIINSTPRRLDSTRVGGAGVVRCDSLLTCQLRPLFDGNWRSGSLVPY
jgi:ribosomal protein S7